MRIFLALAALIVLSGAYKVRHHYYLQKLDGHEYFTSDSYREPIFPKLNQEQVLNLGWAHVDSKTLIGPFSKHRSPKSSYSNFSESKIPKTIRIGIFGDSFVWGDEAAYAFDFPTLLQGLFHQVGRNHVQVLNFGVSGYGVHQTLMMWEYLGKKYDLDYSIFLPFDFHIDRDLTFNRHLNKYCPIHARYIVTRTGLSISPVMGSSRKEACSLYHRVLTPWQYIAYDRNAPTFLRILVPKGRQFKINPFYYSDMGKKEEALATYKMLFKRLAAEANHPIILCSHADICGLQESLSDDIYFYNTRKLLPLPGLYLAPKSHPSALGNEIRAQELYSFLTAQKPGELKVITLASKPDLTKEGFESSPPLNQYDQIFVGIQGHTAADFVSHKNGAHAWMFEKDLDFKRDAIASLLWVYNREGLQFIPVLFPLENGDTVFARVELDNDIFRIPIGQIEAGSSIIGRLRLTCREWITASGHHTWRLKCSENSLSSLRIEGTGGLQSVKIEIGENARLLMNGEGIEGIQKLKNTVKNIFNVKLRLTISLKPVISSVASLRAKAGSLTLKESQINDIGTLDLLVQTKNGQPRSFPIIPYHIVAVSAPQSHPVYSYPVR